MPNEPNHHRIDYIEFAATDIEATKKFYSACFGWKFTDYGPDYTSFEDGRLAGGFDKTSSAVKTSPLIVLYSSELEKTKSTVLLHGGTIVKKIYSFPGGRRFHFKDPNGNELAVWSE
jgi:hypothetical protein